MGVLFKHGVIIGGGLMGTSLALALRERGVCERLVMVDRESSVLSLLRGMGMETCLMGDIAGVVGACDLVVLAVPVGCYGEVLRACASHLKGGALVTDVGSVKGCVMKEMASSLPSSVSYVPSHPLAGTENSGPMAADSTLYQGRVCVVTPVALAPISASDKKIMALWEAIGMDVLLMSSQDHDVLLAFSSHLPHVIAYALTMCIRERGDEKGHDIERVSGGGLKDFTRIAASDSVMWRDIFLANRANVCSALRDFSRTLRALSTLIERGDGASIESTLSQLRHFKRSLDDKGGM